ncbi:MAG: protease self-immunity family protein [Bacillales bacterium]|jgi:membrane protease YdiL (CAAX protease family)|nr:protease self-immunity family protein [Bacillales bacterium]
MNNNIENMSSEDLLKNLYLTQLLLFILSIIFILLFKLEISFIKSLFVFDIFEILKFGVVTGFLIIFLELIVSKMFPKEWLDDGGINEKIFCNRSIIEIFVIAVLVSFTEELLFRGILQTTFGIVWSSSIFAFIHFRYLNKPILLIFVILISFVFGWIFEITGSLWTTIIAHFLVDFILGIILARDYKELY